MRVLVLRQKVLFASRESESGIQYNQSLVQRMCLHTILTGLQSDSVRVDMQPLLLNCKTSDELLLERLNVACANETERRNKKKFSTPQAATHISKVHSEELRPTNCPGEEKPKVSREVRAELTELKASVASLKDLSAEIAQIRETLQQAMFQPQSYLPPSVRRPVREPQPPFAKQNYYSKPPAPPWNTSRPAYVPRRCCACQQGGRDVKCTHCYRCGSGEHFQAGCKIRGGRPLKEETIAELTREREGVVRVLCGTPSPLAIVNPPSMQQQQVGTQQHLMVEPADSKAKIRRLRQELEERNEQLLDNRHKQENMEEEIKRLQQENLRLLVDARAARAYRDELDALRERAIKADKLELYKAKVEKGRQGMEEAYTIATVSVRKAAERGKKHYDTKVRSSVLQPGERILIKNLTPEGGKIDKSMERNKQQPVSHLQETDQDSGYEDDFHYEPLQVLNERDAQGMESEHRPLPANQRLGVKGPASGPVQREDDYQREDLPGEGTNLAVEDPRDDHLSETSPPTGVNEPEALTYERPRRERHPPRRTTYDQLGVPSCYSTQSPHQLLPSYPAPGVVPWLGHLQPYYIQPPFMYGLQRA
ncbi:uncharacterized protein LOC144070684 [Stigmatopora argus]